MLVLCAPFVVLCVFCNAFNFTKEAFTVQFVSCHLIDLVLNLRFVAHRHQLPVCAVYLLNFLAKHESPCVPADLDRHHIRETRCMSAMGAKPEHVFDSATLA